MSAAVVHPCRESIAIRRVSLLLERLRQDGQASDPQLVAVHSGVDLLQRAADAGRSVRRRDVRPLEEIIADNPVPPLQRSEASTAQLLRWSIFIETRELLRRLR